MVELNHTIVWATDRDASAGFLAGILGLAVGAETAPFLPVVLGNGVTLDFAQAERVAGQHYAFLVSDAEFDAALARLTASGTPVYADPLHRTAGLNTMFGGRGCYFADPDGHNLELLTKAG
ncbi:VOC family protein [Amycolatopsis rhabdoformis]|uniref:VOC family protein n=1 Tax=Amycolatopsis rhabdoformis TaxID=1448059 RepID=A0ABZ1IH08_9PSEU|nr:VOC family protein [Amycolatopsis rhabdoformis]WSE32958.1 VOC family protein [Amycolatopsis rhabdoformis]